MGVLYPLFFFFMFFELPLIAGLAAVNKGKKNLVKNSSVSSDNYDNYIDSISSNLNSSDYLKLLSSNPYRSYDYSPTFWDKLGNIFNFNTEEDRLRMQMQQSSKDYAAQVSQLQFENDYNSESSKVERMKAAGLNPDLNGSVSGASESSEFNQEQFSPDLSSIGTQFHNVANHVINAVVMGLDLSGKVIGLKSMINGLDSQDLANAESATGLAGHLVDSLSDFGYQPSMLAHPRGGISYQSGDSLVMMPSPKLNSRNLERFSSSFNRLYHSTSNYKNIYSNIEQGLKSRQNVVLSRSSKYYNDDDSFLADIIVPLVEFNDKLTYLNYKNQYDFESNRDYKNSAISFNYSDDVNISDSKFHLDIQKPIRTIVHRLSSTAKEHSNDMQGVTASCILLFMNALQSGLLK